MKIKAALKRAKGRGDFGLVIAMKKQLIVLENHFLLNDSFPLIFLLQS